MLGELCLFIVPDLCDGGTSRMRQGQGIDKQLLNAVKCYSKDKKLAEIVLHTSEYAPGS